MEKGGPGRGDVRGQGVVEKDVNWLYTNSMGKGKTRNESISSKTFQEQEEETKMEDKEKG